MSAVPFWFTKKRSSAARSGRRCAAWLAACASDPKTASWFAIGFVAAHAVLWTLILIELKAAQDVHMDVAEAFAWGEKFQLGYGKHPPLSGWIAGLWFMVFPVADWSTYALAMTTLGCGLVFCWLIARRVVDRRRAFVSVVMLALYPIFNFKGYKYNVDLVQLATLPLVVLAYLHAFETRTARAGLWLGLAAALALLTKYWALTLLGAVGFAALLHPDRSRFLRSPAPWAAIATMAIAMLPHLWWLRQVDFEPLTYANEAYGRFGRALSYQTVLGYLTHNFALSASSLVVAGLALICAWTPSWSSLVRHPLQPLRRAWSSGANPGIRRAQALNIWIIQIVIAAGPPIGGAILAIYVKTDWGIPLFFLIPLALVAIPRLRIPKVALPIITMTYLAIMLAVLAASRTIAIAEFRANPDSVLTYATRAQLAHELTELWHTRFSTPWAAVAGPSEIGQPMTFYSPDHPVLYAVAEIWSSALTTLGQVQRQGFIGICDPRGERFQDCESWMAANAANAERLTITTRRFFHGMPGPAASWKVYVVPPH